MASIQSLGIGSGLLTSELVDSIISTERTPVEARLNAEQAVVDAKISAYGEIVSAVNTFGTSVQSLALPSTFSASTAVSTNDNAVSATASSVAVPGSYVVEVTTLAQSHSIASDAYTTIDEVVGTGTLTFRFGQIDFDSQNSYQSFTVNGEAQTQSIQINSSNNTLAGIRDAINEEDFGVQASIVDDGSGFRLLFSTTEAGKNNSIELAATGDTGIRALNYNFASETATLNAVTAVGGLDISTGAGLDTAAKAFTLAVNGTNLSVQVASDVAIGNSAQVVTAVQSALDTALAANGFSAGDVVVKQEGDRLRFSSLASGFTSSLEIISDGAGAIGVGASAISDGFDFSANNASFSLSVDGAAAVDIVVNTVTASRQETVAALNQELTSAGISADVQASLNSNNDIVLQRTQPGASTTISVSAIDALGTAASAELGLSNGSFEGLDGFGLLTGAGVVTGSERLSQTIAAQDAVFSVNGLTVTRNSNLIAGVVSGTTLNLKSTTTGPVTITVDRDSSGLIENIQSFVDSYNVLKTLSNNLTAFDPSAGANGQGSLLLGDSTLRSLVSSVNSLLRSTVTGLTGSIRSLAEIGITTNQNNSFRLEFNTTVFESRYATDAQSIRALFSNAGTSSDAQISFISSAAGTVPGSYDIEIDSLATVGSYRGLSVPSLAAGNIVIDDSNDNFTVSLNGFNADITLSQATYTSAAALAEQLQSQINSASLFRQGNHSVSVVFDAVNNRFGLTSNLFGSNSNISFVTADSGIANTLGFALEGQGPFAGNQLGGLATATGGSSEAFSSAFILDANTSFDLSIDGRKTALLTIPGNSATPLSYATPDALIAAISAQIDADGTFAAQAASSSIGQTISAGQNFSTSSRAFSLSVDEGQTDVNVVVSADASSVSFDSETPGTVANSLAAIQDAINKTTLGGLVNARLDASNRVFFETVSTGSAATLSVTNDGSGAVFTATTPLDAAGFDFAVNNASFDIAIDGEAAISISLNQSSASRAETVQLVQNALSDAGIATRVTASLDGSNQLQLTRSSDTGSSTQISISNLNATSLAALGLSNSSADGLDGFGLSSTPTTGADQIVVGIDYSFEQSTRLGRLQFSSSNQAHIIEFDNVSTNAANKLGVFIGDGTLTTSTTGLDVSGKINGITAVGRGQDLLAATGNVQARPGFYLNAAVGNLASSTTNDGFTVVVDGVSSSSISLGTIQNTTPSVVATQLQNAINNNPLILAGGVSVNVEFDQTTGGFGIISSSLGATSNVSLSALTGNAAAIFGFSIGQGVAGVTGTNAQGRPDPSAGIRVKVSGGALGSRGSVNFVRGVSNQLDALLDSFVSSDGLLTNRTSGLNRELADIASERVSLARRIQSSEDRLRASFLANDLIISSLNTTASFLTSQLTILENLVSGRRNN